MRRHTEKDVSGFSGHLVSPPDVSGWIKKEGRKHTERMIDQLTEQTCQLSTETAESSHASICKLISPPLSSHSRKCAGSVSTTVPASVSGVRSSWVNREEVKGRRAVGLVKIPFSLLQGYYVMALGIGQVPG